MKLNKITEYDDMPVPPIVYIGAINLLIDEVNRLNEKVEELHQDLQKEE